MNLTGYSTALFSTWYFVEDYGVLFDAGDGVIAHLLQKAMKAKYIFITHPDRDHLTGLTQLVQLNSRDGFPKIYYPKDCGSFPALSAFLASFDPHTSGSEWIGIEEGTEIQVGKDLIVKPIANDHVRKVVCVPQTTAGKTESVKSLSYQLIRTKRKLKPEFLALTHKEILQQKQTIGEEAMTEEVRQILLSYSGDTPVSHDGRWQGSEVLIHEATFLHKHEADHANPHANRHSSLEEVMQMVSQTSVGKLVLGHFSSRYSDAEIGKAIATYAKQFDVKIPIYALMPSVCLKDILKLALDI